MIIRERKSVQLKSVADPDVKIRGETVIQTSRPWDKGGALLKEKKFFWPFGPQFGLKMNCPWVENRGKMDEEETVKDSVLRWELRKQYPGYNIHQCKKYCH